MINPVTQALFLLVIAIVSAACSAGTTTASPAGSTAPSASQGGQGPASIPPDFPFGSWTTTITMDDLEASGISGANVLENAGLFTLTMSEDGSWETTQVSEADLKWPIFRGTWVATGPNGFRQETTFPPDFAGDIVDFTWKLEDGSLLLEVVNPPDPVLPIVMESHPWMPAG